MAGFPFSAPRFLRASCRRKSRGAPGVPSPSPRRGHRDLPTLLLRDAAPAPPSPAFCSKSLPYRDPGAAPGEALRQDVLKAGDDSALSTDPLPSLFSPPVLGKAIIFIPSSL